MVLRSRELYRSSNGDRWSLVRSAGDEPVRVRHEANAASGGAIHDLRVGDFLTRGGNGPEKQELLRLIGSLVGPSDGSQGETEGSWAASYDQDDDDSYRHLTDPGADPTTG